ncbi:MAG: ABC transporter ATP-binding protein [Solirubrobacteraceae bacterium]
MAIIEVDRLHKRYDTTIAVDDVSFTVVEGEILGVLGRNGAGKTTTVECLAGLRVPDRGRVRVAGYDPVADPDAVRRLVGVQLQEAALPLKLRAGEALELYASFYDDPADVDVLLDGLGLAAKRRTRFRDLSGGQRQRLSIALALVGRPRVVILDELTTGLDPHARRDVWGLVEGIRSAGVTVVLVTHLMDEAQRLCDRVVIVHRGRVVAADRPDALIARTAPTRADGPPASLEDAFVALTTTEGRPRTIPFPISTLVAG